MLLLTQGSELNSRQLAALLGAHKGHGLFEVLSFGAGFQMKLPERGAQQGFGCARDLSTCQKHRNRGVLQARPGAGCGLREAQLGKGLAGLGGDWTLGAAPQHPPL